ncbi:MAG: hypothetical protein JKX80_01965 [Candidatus Pacebacteria bacterium]|nr:hypothetical protein [Candidatus Paceibacterota bacterium]
MIDIIKQNKVVLVIVILIIIAFVWFGFLSERKPTTSLLTSETRSDDSAAEQEILRLLLDMRSIRLDDTIFKNPAFTSLRDFGRDIIPEPVGRTNPFVQTDNLFEVSEEDQASSAVFEQ